MQCRISFKNMNSSPALSTYTEQKVLNKIEKYATKPIEAHITFVVEGLEHRAHCSVKGGDGFNLQVESLSGDMYSSIDALIDKLEIQLKRHKEKLKRHKYTNNIKKLDLDSPSVDWDQIPVDADELIKYERARRNAS